MESLQREVEASKATVIAMDKRRKAELEKAEEKRRSELQVVEERRRKEKEELETEVVKLRRRLEDVEIPFKPARVILQDFTGVPCHVNLTLVEVSL